MDINCVCPAYKCNIMEFLPYFLDVDEDYDNIKITPSRLLTELQMSTEERLEKLYRPPKRKKLASHSENFGVLPDIVIFQNFKARHVYKAKITLQNLHSASRHISIIKNFSPYFEVTHGSDSSSMKIAPGMSFSINVTFKPVEFRDHIFSVKFVTEGETFNVPVHGLGERPFLSFPDQVTFNPTAVRVPSEKSLLLHNFGKSPTCFVASCREPCKVSPVRSSLRPNQITEMKITCTPTSLKSVTSDLHFAYDDIKMVVPMSCQVVRANVYLNVSSVTFEDTFMGLQNHRKLTAYNCSPFLLDFKWKNCKSSAMEDLERSKLAKAIASLAELEKKKTAKLEYMNVIDAEGHSAIIDQELSHEIEDTESHFLFRNTVFSILPLTGRILPNQSLEFSVNFSPETTEHYSEFAYFDVTGIEERIALYISGGGKGPQVKVNVKSLNTNDIFLHAINEYQIVVMNDGNIPATVAFVEMKTVFGGVITCDPPRHFLYCRDVCKSFVVRFRSEFQGQFVEKIQFVIEESKEFLDVLFTGNVICPLLKSDTKEIGFGEVSYGSQPSKEFVLTNVSQVPIDFNLHVGDKEENGAEGDMEEFQISPREGVIEPFSSCIIKVTCATQALQEIQETLMVVMWGSDRYSIGLPLSYNCVCPVVECIPEEVFINFCFLNYEYKRTVIVKNKSNVNGFMTYTPTESSVEITCVLNKKEFMIFPNEEIDIELTITTHKLGIQEFPLIFTMAGSTPKPICTVICNGQGPVVSYEPDEIQFERVKLLTTTSKTLNLINESPIIANINVSIPSPSSPFTCDSTHVQLAPEDQQALVVTGYLTDTGKYREFLNVEIENSETIAVPIKADGVGSSILCEPIVSPEFDAGVLLTHQTFRLRVKHSNLGRKRYKMMWTRKRGLRSFKELSSEDVTSGGKKPPICYTLQCQIQGDSPNWFIRGLWRTDRDVNLKFWSVFRLEPNYFELGYSESQQIEIIGSSKRAQAVQEDFYCFALIGKSTKLTLIMSCLMKAEFVEPNVRFSEASLSFLYATGDYPTYFEKTRFSSTISIDYAEFYRPPVTSAELTITNDTAVPLKLTMKTTGEYFINNAEEIVAETSHELKVGDEFKVRIEFRPTIHSKRYRKSTGRFTVHYHQHPKEENIDLVGEIMYPTVKLIPDRYNFECLPLDSYTKTTIFVQNITCIPLRYSWELLEDGFEIENLKIMPEYRAAPSVSSPDSSESEDSDAEGTDETVQDARGGRPKIKKPFALVDVPSMIIKTRCQKDEIQKDAGQYSSIVSENAQSAKSLNDARSGSIEELNVIWDNETYEAEAIKSLRGIVSSHETLGDAEFTCCSDPAEFSSYRLSNIVTVEAAEGVLAPFEFGIVTIGFFPPPHVKVKCTAVCKVGGGEEEAFYVTGISSRISYKFDKQVIEFGRKLYSEILESNLVLTNTGHSKFHFNDSGSEEFNNYIPPGWSGVNPSEGCLHAGKSQTLSVKYFPGRTGEFWDTISFEIGYLEPRQIRIHGYATFSQLTLSLPREMIAKDCDHLSYKAIASITESYLLSFGDVNNENITKYERRRGCPKDINEAAYRALLKNGWVVISENNIYPTESEIDLSRERVLLNEFFDTKSCISSVSVTRKADAISEFTLPPYVLDFGHVMIHRPVCYTVLLVNNGPVETEVRLTDANRKRLDSVELKIEFKSKRLGVGDKTELFVIFSPTRRRGDPLEKRVDECVFLSVKNGAKIPIVIRAVAATPAIGLDYSCVDFENAKIGSAVRRSIIIRNDGNLPSKWSTELRTLNEQTENVFHVIPNKGELSPGEKDLLNIYWVPIKKGLDESELTIRVERNSVNKVLTLRGHALESVLAIVEPKISFEPCLPYSEKIVKSLVVQNTSAFPIEYCFSDIDRDYDEEKHHAELYLLYHNYDFVLIPERLPGYRLPEFFQLNYYFLVNQIKDRLLPEERSNDIEGSCDFETKSHKDEIFRSLIEHIETIPGGFDDSNTDVCPMDEEVNCKMAIIDPEKQINFEPEQRNGIFIIFHGGPLTNCYKAANRAGIALDMDVYSIDRLIGEELAFNEDGPAVEINEIIETALTGYYVYEKLPEEDDYDLLWRKINTFLNKEKKSSSRKLRSNASANDSSDRMSSKKSTKSNATRNSTTLMDIPVDLLVELLKRRFENKKTKIVIESLNSEFLRRPNVALICLLRAIGSVKYIQLIVLSFTSEDYVSNEMNRLIENGKLNQEVADAEDSGSPKTGKTSAKPKKQVDPSKNYLKQISKNLSKDLKKQFEEFRELLDEILHVCEFWERRFQNLIKAYSKASTMPKKDAKSFVTSESKSSNRKRGKLGTSSTVNFLDQECVGVCLWVISNSYDDRMTDLDVIPAALKADPDLNEALADFVGAVGEIEESTTVFSVVRPTKSYPKCTNDHFRIYQTVFDKQENMHLAASSIAGSLRKKTSRRKYSTERKNVSGVNTSAYIETLRTRDVLTPGETAKYQIAFTPSASGKYENNYLVELVGVDRPFSIQCNAVCELPDIVRNPDVLYPRNQETRRNKTLGDNFVFYKEENVFDLGYIFVGSHKTQPYSTKITLKSASALPCDVTAVLSENSLFTLDEPSLHIEPQESAQLPVSLKAIKKGRIQSDLFVTVKYNPRVKIIRLAAHACPVEFSVHPKALVFEKVPLSYSDKRKITLTNASPVNLHWKFSKAEWAAEVYNISKMSGVVKLYSVDEIIVEYFSTQEEVNPKKSFDIQVFDPNHSTTIPVYKDELSITSDSVEYQVDYKTHFDLGDVKGRTQIKIPFHLNNTGKSNVTLMFSEVNTILPERLHAIRKFFKLNTDSVVIPPQKSAALTISFNSSLEMSFENVPVFNCNLVENNNTENVIRSSVLKFSGVVHLAKFELCPTSDLYFGYQQVGLSKFQKIELKNTGTFPFDYVILSFEDSTFIEDVKKRRNSELKKKSILNVFKKIGSARSRTTSPKNKEKNKAKSPKVTKLETPGFTVHSSSGTVPPNGVAVINVECIPEETKEYDQGLVIFVSECQKEDFYGRTVTLHVEGAEPHCIFDDYKKMFREQFVVQELADFICPENIDSYSVFVASETAIYLKNICVNEKYAMTIYLQNLGQVTAEVSVKLEQKNEFTVSPSMLFIEPYETKTIRITFVPESINEFENKLMISYNSRVSDIFILSLIAESCVPQISLLEPVPDIDKEAKIDFIPTYIGLTQSRRICIENIGSISCKLILEFCESPKVFYLVPQGDMENILDKVEFEKDFDVPLPSLMVNLLPKKKGYFDLVFKPYYERFFSVRLKIHTVNNPFEIVTITITGQSYESAIYVDGLETVNLNKSTSSTPYIGYILDFGFSSLNKLLKQSFTLKNNTDSDVYKFEFVHQTALIISPRVGHLKPNTSKEIFAVISTKSPLCLQKVKIDCNYMCITYLDPDVTISWDDRQQLIDWEPTKKDDTTIRPQYYKDAVNIATREMARYDPDIENNTRCILYRSEPEYIPSANVWDVIPIFVSVTADYASYECEVKELIFPDTLVKEKSEVSFPVSNTGKVPIHIAWMLHCDEVIPQRSSSAGVPGSSDQTGTPTPFLAPSLSSTTLFSSIESRTETDELPFEIRPHETVVIQPNDTATFSLIFSPTSSSQYYARLTSEISSLDPRLRNVDVSVTAEGLVPECYFEIEETDYFTRRPPLKKCIEASDAFKVVELTSVGIGVASTRTFNVVNTSKQMLLFTIDLLATDTHFSYFTCKTPTGTITPGKKTEIAFSFIPQELGTFEEYYKFSMESVSLPRTPLRKLPTILLAGHCRDPRVSFLRAHVPLSPTLLGVPSEERVSLRNDEEAELDFKFVKHSLFSQEHDQRLRVVPMSGSVNPKSEFEVRLIYNAEKIGEVNFYLKCAIEKMKSLLNLNVSATCLEVLCSLSYTNKNGVSIPLDPDRENTVDLGNIGIKLKRITKVTILNTGRTGFFYNWKFNKKSLEGSIAVAVSGEKDFVSAGSAASTDIVVESLRPHILRDFRMKLEITYGPTYVVKLNAAAHEPLCKFSFTSYNFGCCIVQKSCAKYNEVLLKARNFESVPIMIQNLFENNKNLTVDFKTSPVQSNSTQTIPISFHPQAVGKYEISVPFVVKSTKKIVKIEGEGVRLNLQLMNLNDRFVTLEPVKLGSKRRHAFELLNKTPTRVKVLLFFADEYASVRREDVEIEPEMVAPEERTPSKELNRGGKRKADAEEGGKNVGKKKNEDKMKADSLQKLNEIANVPARPISKKSYISYLMIHPKEYVTIEPNKKHEYVIEFNPKERIEKFSEKIFYKVQDIEEPLCVVRGTCKAGEFALDKDILTFSNIVVNCENTKKVLLMNTGDIQGRFKWTFEESLQDYKIYPLEGITSPNSEIKINVSFKPSGVYCQLAKKAKCIINMKTVLELKLIGNSLNLPQATATIDFSCPVREITATAVNVPNNYQFPWTLKPVLSKDIFWVPNDMRIETGTSPVLDIQYRPQFMTKSKPDQATLLLPLPEGQAILYDLVGTALSPLPVKKLFLEIRCKEDYTETLKIKNWLDAIQLFEVKTELTSEVTPKTIYKTFGNDLVEAPPNKTCEYKWNVYVMNEEDLEMKVIFTNIRTGEYLFYEVSLKVLPSDPLDTIRLRTCVREPVTTTIKLKNPINLPVTFNVSGSPDLQYEKTVSMRPYTIHDLDVCFCPLKMGELRTNLEVTCEQLGTFVYVFELLANPPSPERTLKFKTELGDREFNAVFVKNTFSASFELTAKFEHPVFSTDKIVSIPVGDTGKISIRFEPSEIGIIESRAVLSSTVTGDYIYPLFGECVHPTPKGPFFVKLGGSVSIPFNNPFNEQKTFEYKVDSNCFTMKTTTEAIKPRKATKIVVNLRTKSLEGGIVLKYPITAKLVANCTDPDLEFIRWVFYLQSDQ